MLQYNTLSQTTSVTQEDYSQYCGKINHPLPRSNSHRNTALISSKQLIHRVCRHSTGFVSSFAQLCSLPHSISLGNHTDRYIYMIGGLWLELWGQADYLHLHLYSTTIVMFLLPACVYDVFEHPGGGNLDANVHLNK